MVFIKNCIATNLSIAAYNAPSTIIVPENVILKTRFALKAAAFPLFGTPGGKCVLPSGVILCIHHPVRQIVDLCVILIYLCLLLIAVDLRQRFITFSAYTYSPTSSALLSMYCPHHLHHEPRVSWKQSGKVTKKNRCP